MSQRKCLSWPALISLAPLLLTSFSCGSGKPPIIVGSKNDPEQLLLGEIIAQQIEKKMPDRKVIRKLGLGNTMMMATAIIAGEVDLFPEDAGTALVAILKEEPIADGTVAFERVRSELQREYQVTSLNPLGYSHQYVFVAQDPPIKGLEGLNMSDAIATKRSFKLSVSHDFLERKDGFQMLMTRYQPSMAKVPQVLESDKMYDGLKTGQVEWAAGFNTDPWLDQPGFRIMSDDMGIFTKQPAFIAARKKLLDTFPELRPALEMLSGKFTDESMRKLGAEIAIKKRSPVEVAKEFLASAGL